MGNAHGYNKNNFLVTYITVSEVFRLSDSQCVQEVHVSGKEMLGLLACVLVSELKIRQR